MSAPSNNVYADGGASVTGDGFNTFVQTVSTMADLRAFIGTTGMQVSVLGQNAVNDLGGGVFYWNDLGTAPDDNGVTTVVPSGSGAGEWTRLKPTSSLPARMAQSAASPAGTVSAVGVMMGLAIPFTPNSTGNVLLLLSGDVGNSALGGGSGLSLRYGTGTAPGNGTAIAGTELCKEFAGTAGVLQIQGQVPFCLPGYVGGLIVGTPYWVDLGLTAVNGGTSAPENIFITVIEL